MKKLLWTIALILATFSFAGCDPIENNGDDPTEVCDKCGENPCVCENEGTDPGPDNAPLQPSEQKEKLVAVGKKLMDKMPASEWESYSKLVDDFANSVYASEDYDWGTMEEWFDKEFNEAYKEDESLTIEGDKHTIRWTTDIVLLMANHTGLFTCTEDGIIFSEYEGGTKAVLTLNGKTYEAEIKSSGKVTEAKYVFESEEYGMTLEPGEVDPETGEVVKEAFTRVYVDKISVTVGVPEQIDINITENGSPLATATMKFTPSFTADGLDITTDSFSVQTTISMNGFEVISEKVAFDGMEGKAASKIEFRKNGENLISTSASADAKLNMTEVNGGEYLVLEKAKNIDMSLDILSEIQVKGTCSNAIEASESLEMMWDALYNDSTADLTEAKRHLDNFNAKFGLDVYYDGTDVKQATVAFDLESYEYDDYVDYDLIPIIVFGDGSKYKVEEFFTENAFGSLIDSFEALCKSFTDLFGFEF